MKRVLLSLLIGAAALGLQAAQPTTGIKGTMHDLSATGYKTVTNVDQICVFCHTPHNAQSGAAQIIPLWNHTTTTATFTPYTLIDGTSLDYTALPGVSLACLSCHDGTVAVGSMVNIPYGFGTGQATPLSYAGGSATSQVDKTSGLMVGTHALGSNLSNDHPINVVYDVDMVAPSVLVTNNIPLFDASGKSQTQAYGLKVQCASCHDVHNWGGAGITGAPFLRVNNTGSALCLTCHIK